MDLDQTHIGFIGFGHMAQVIYQALSISKHVNSSQVFFNQRDVNKAQQNKQLFGIEFLSLKNLVEQSRVLVLGVRPIQTEQVLKDLSLLDLRNKMLITVVAGIPLEVYQRILGPHIQIVRAMPNIASSVGLGMSVLSFSSNASSDFRSFSRLFFSCMGKVKELDESLMDISCGIAGSGPGFVFRLIDAMAKEGVSQGIPYIDALQMASQVFKGASELILQGNKPEDLLTQITVPGGTTEAGINVMKEKEIEKHLQMTVRAAAEKSRKLRSIS